VILSAVCPAELVVLALGSFFQETPPELVVEVASPRTRLYDRNRKKDVYQDFGIPAYWIVEPSSDRPELTVFELRSGSYEQTAHVTGAEEYRAALPFQLTIAPSQLVTAR
jgi:Uma2 family endonuclease